MLVGSNNDLKLQTRNKSAQLVERIHACLCAEILGITHHGLPLALHAFILSGTSDTLSCSEGTQGQRRALGHQHPELHMLFDQSLLRACTTPQIRTVLQRPIELAMAY